MSRREKDKDEWRTGIILGLMIAAMMLAKILF